MEIGNKVQLCHFNKYYGGGLTQKTFEIGKGNLKFKLKRKAKKFLIWYFNDKFSLTLNLVGLIGWVVKNGF